MSAVGRLIGFGHLAEFDFSRFDTRDVIRISAVATIVTAIPVAMGDPTAAISLSIGAVFTGVAEAGLPYGYRWRTMLWTALWLMVGVFVGSTVSDHIVAAIAISIPFAFIAGAVGYRGPRAAVAGLLSLVVLTIYSGTPVPLYDAFTNSALMGLGGLAQVAVAVIASIALGRHRIPTTREQPPPWRSLLTVKRNFLIHGVRLAVVIGVATAISEAITWPHQYWLPMTVAWMSKPDRDGTVVRVIHRVAGTILGVIIIAGVDYVFSPGLWGFFAMSMIGASIAVSFIWVHYASAVVGVTIWVIGLFALLSDPVAESLILRIVLTLGAAALVILGALIHLPHSRSSTQ
ncbi:MAG: hypothetical protein RJB01_1856 [Actinomycetota bacterium]|jgi:uncharacterized membrane protein YccC